MSVIKVSNSVVRTHIENFTLQYCKPHMVYFIQDGNGDWVTSIESLQNAWIEGSKQDLKQYLSDNGLNIPNGLRTVKDVLNNYGEVITYVP